MNAASKGRDLGKHDIYAAIFFTASGFIGSIVILTALGHYIYEKYVKPNITLKPTAETVDTEILITALEDIRTIAKSWEGRALVPYWNLGDKAAMALKQYQKSNDTLKPTEDR
jgi:hypothetical protein